MDNSLLFFSLLLRGVEDILNNPPDTAAYGQGYIVGPTPTGAWAGRANCIAMRNQQNSWAFLPDHTLSDGPQHGLGRAIAGTARRGRKFPAAEVAAVAPRPRWLSRLPTRCPACSKRLTLLWRRYKARPFRTPQDIRPRWR